MLPHTHIHTHTNKRDTYPWRRSLKSYLENSARKLLFLFTCELWREEGGREEGRR